MNKLLSNKLFSFCLGLAILCSCSNTNDLPKIGIAGIAIECSTFSPAKSTIDDFRIKRGNDIFGSYPYLHKDSIFRNSANWVPAIVARTTPGGIVTKETYDKMVSEILDSLSKNLPYDALFFDIHGAMSVEGMDDPEGDFIIKVRYVIGDKPIISTCMDLHGSVSHKLVENTDIITCYRKAPHEDSMESKQRAG